MVFVMDAEVKIDNEIFNGRPSMLTVIGGIKRNCLLDTGARINVIDEKNIKQLQVPMSKHNVTPVVCANGSGMELSGTYQIKVKFQNITLYPVFYIAKTVFPSIIFRIELIRSLGLDLRWRFDAKNIKQESICTFS